ncbi:hypothetical protein [Schleiferilactobacillus shenzhenensis]|uniref:hypothetical protein n=1 Tax=Schleiferilactobacillus shenzhenensis TaxID=1231337 RepID=UPI00058E50AC|nr:hypothetical protein [Schleiferilactobacillus shenzhenensis]
MMKHVYRFLAVGFALVAFLFLGLLSQSNGTANASNVDSDWAFWLAANQGNSYTGTRTKENATSAYLLNYSSSNTGVNAWVQLGNGTEVGSPKTHAGLGEEIGIWNNAFENYGRTGIRLAIEQDRSLPFAMHAAGRWSPDSVGF